MQNKNSKINNKCALVYGGVVLDTLFDLNGNIHDQILIKNDKIGKQNLMFNAKEKQVYYGGTAGNIAYGLGLLGEKALLASIAGRDFSDYAKHIKHNGIENRIYIDENGYTATFYGMTDANKEQIGVFQGNSYYTHANSIPLARLLKQDDWAKIKIAIFSPGTAESITRNIKEFRTNVKDNAVVILDPGQMLAIDFTPRLIEQAIKNSDMLILNENEDHYLKTHLKITNEKMWNLGLKYYIVTLAEKGSVLHTRESSEKIPAQKVKKVIDPTGAGDAYRAGLIYGLIAEMPLLKSMALGAKMGARAITQKGGQTYRILSK